MAQKTVQINWSIDDAFLILEEPDLYRAREWTGGVRVIETCVGAYGALDTKTGTQYFDVGDALVKVKTDIGSFVTVVNGKEVVDE